MNQPVVIFSDLLPPKRGGLADHTYRLAELLSADHPVAVISSVGVSTDAPFSVRPIVESWHHLTHLRTELARLPANSILFWQYVPHMYGRGGVNRALPQFVQEQHRAGRWQVVLAHEIAADYTWHPVRAWYAWNHRRQWCQLLEAADCVPVGCSRWVETWQQRQPRFAHKLFTLASPSNLPLAPVPADHRSRWRLAHGLDPDATILAYFGTLDPSKQLPWILAAWTAAFTKKRPVVLVLIGATPTVSIEEKYRPYFRPLGHLPAEAASQALSAVDLLALPFIDGISERRGSLMGGLQHGVSIVSTTGHNTGAKLRQADWLTLTPVSDCSAFVRAVGQLLSHSTKRAHLGAAGQEQYLRAYSWPIILGQLHDRFPR